MAALSRIELADKEADDLQKDIDKILDYVGQIQEVAASFGAEPEIDKVHNVLREDENPYEEGESRKEIISAFPEKDGDYLKVKKIL